MHNCKKYYRRCRKMEPGKTAYVVIENTVATNESKLYMDLYNKDTGVEYFLQMTALKGDTFRLHINEKNPLNERYEVKGALKGPPETRKLTLVERTSDHATVLNGNGKAVVYFNPFRVDLYSDNVLVISANARGLMRFEHQRIKLEKFVTLD